MALMFWGPQFVLGVNAETPSSVVGENWTVMQLKKIGAVMLTFLKNCLYRT